MLQILLKRFQNFASYLWNMVYICDVSVTEKNEKRNVGLKIRVDMCIYECNNGKLVSAFLTRSENNNLIFAVLCITVILLLNSLLP